MTKLPDGWELKRLSDCLEKLKSGKKAERGWSPQCLSHPSGDENVWGVLKTTSVQMGKFQPEYNKELPDSLAPKSELEVNSGDFLVTTTGPRNRCGIVCHVEKTRKKLIFSGKILRFRVDESLILPNWLMYLLMSPEYQSILDKMKVGTSDSSVSIGNQQILDLEIPVPPIDEQQKIVELLEDHFSHLDAAIADVKLAKMKAAQFRVSILDSIFFDSGDKGWPIHKFANIGKWITGSTPSSKVSEFTGTDVPFITPGDVSNGGEISDFSRRISNKGADAVRRLKPDSVHLVCIGATLGKVGIARFETTSNQQINALEANLEVALPDFVMWLLASPAMQSKLWQASSSTTVPILNKGNLEKIEVRIPDVRQQNKALEEFEYTRITYEHMSNNFQQLFNNAQGLRRSLLQQAFTGQLTKEVVNV